MSNDKRISLRKHERLMAAHYTDIMNRLRDQARREVVAQVGAERPDSAKNALYWFRRLLGDLS